MTEAEVLIAMAASAGVALTPDRAAAALPLVRAMRTADRALAALVLTEAP